MRRGWESKQPFGLASITTFLPGTVEAHGARDTPPPFVNRLAEDGSVMGALVAIGTRADAAQEIIDIEARAFRRLSSDFLVSSGAIETRRWRHKLQSPPHRPGVFPVRCGRG